MVLKKEATLFSRDEKGELIPQEVELEIDEEDTEQIDYRGETIVITPMTRGKVRRLFSNLEEKKKNGEKEKDSEKEKDLDADMLLEHCKNPSYTKEDVPFLKISYVNMITNTIMRESGLNPGKSKKKALQEKEDSFSKNWEGLNQKEKKEN